MGNNEDEYSLLDISPSKFYVQLEKAQDITEVKRLRDVAAAVENYAKSIKMNTEEINRASEARIWAEYKAGKLLSNMDKAVSNGRNQYWEGCDQDGRNPLLSDLGIDFHQSHRWQLLARLPEDNLRQFIDYTKPRDRLTSAAALREANNYINQKQEWTTPELNRVDFDFINYELFFSVLCQTIRDCVSGEYGDDPKEWLLEGYYPDDEAGDCKLFCEKFGLPFDTICDWVLSGCSSKPTHEVLIDMITNRYEQKKGGNGEVSTARLVSNKV